MVVNYTETNQASPLRNSESRSESPVATYTGQVEKTRKTAAGDGEFS